MARLLQPHCSPWTSLFLSIFATFLSTWLSLGMFFLSSLLSILVQRNGAIYCNSPNEGQNNGPFLYTLSGTIGAAYISVERGVCSSFPLVTLQYTNTNF